MILVLNCGSQSIKWKAFDKNLRLAKEGSREILNSANYKKILEEEIEKIKKPENLEIKIIGHRVVHGGGIFAKPLKITPENLKELEKINYLAPLHNPFNILGIRFCRKKFLKTENIAVFDTEFFNDLPNVSKTYALPEDIAKKFKFQKYGFHGISHEYVAKKSAEKIKKPFDRLKIISCHLGGGSSISAIKNGKAIDTSMGFGPTEGVMMMTRSGDVDNEIILEMAKNYGVEKTRKIINSESGFKGICGESDMLKVLEKIKQDDAKSKLALDIFVYQIKKYIGAYFTILGGCDVLVFTGSIGVGSAKIRNMILKDMNIFKKNLPVGRQAKILIIEPDEELAIANKIKNIKY